LPIFLDRLADPITAVLISITVVLIFGAFLVVDTSDFWLSKATQHTYCILHVVAGEIIPQAVCTRYGLLVGAYSAGFVRVLMLLCGGIAYPISLLLDWVLGSEHSVCFSSPSYELFSAIKEEFSPSAQAMFRRAQLKALVDIHSKDEGLGGNLSSDEILIIRGALDLSKKTAADCMTPLNKVKCFQQNRALSVCLKFLHIWSC
jgi:metal transporter CNNM